MTKFLLIAFCCFFSIKAASQSIIPRFETLGVNEGLPHSSVYSILQDKKGFMWFGTADGLCRYDGANLKTFKYVGQQKNDIVNNFVRGKLMEDRHGNIWYCNESGIYKWDIIKELVTRVRDFSQAKFSNTVFQSIYLDSNEHIWLINLAYGIFEYNINDGIFLGYPLPGKPDLSTVMLNYFNKDPEGNIWLRIGSANDPFIVFNKQKKTFTTELGINPPHAVFFEKGGKVMAYDDKLLYAATSSRPAFTVPKMLDGKKVSFYSFDGISDNYGRLWMTARGNGLFYYDEINKRFQVYQHDNSKTKTLPFDLTTCLYIDRTENLWIGIDGGGVAKLDLKQPKFNLFPLSEGDFPELKDYFTKCFYEDSLKRIWFGSHTGGLNIFDPVKQELKNYHHDPSKKNSLPGNIVGNILRDKDGSIWIGSSGGISKFNEKDGNFFTIPIRNLPGLYPLRNIFVYKMIQLQNGDFLAATLLGIILISRDKHGVFQGNYFKGDNFLNSSTTDLAEMKDGMVYASIPGTGLYQLKPSANGYEHLHTFLNGLDLRSVRRDEKNPDFLWIGSGKGLIHFNTLTSEYKVWNETQGLGNNYVYGSLEDSSGNLWISTNHGLSFFNTDKKSFDNYTFQDGLQSNEFNTQSFYKGNSGNFYFGGIKGFNWFKPGISGSHAGLKPTAAITLIEINNLVFQKDSSYLLHKQINLPYNENDFNFKFAALDFTRPEANRFEYILEGWDATWISGENRAVRYSNLPPGHYTFRLKIANSNGIWSDEEKVSIDIEPPFWKRGWFFGAMLLLLLTTVIVITSRLSQVKAKRKLRLLENQIAINAERNRISADMHDEIGSGITHIALLSEIMQTKKKDQSSIEKDIRTISTSARKLVQTMSEIIWALNPQNDSLDNLLAYTREQSQQYFESLGIDFEISFPEVNPEIRLSNGERRNLYLVTREILNNAMKHSGANAIRLTVTLTDTVVYFSVTDNGKGMELTNMKAGSNGIRNMRKRMEDIGGNINWISGSGGTEVRYSFKICS